MTVADFPPLERITKRFLVSDIAKTFDVLGWFSPSIVIAKILLQRAWEHRIDWDDDVPNTIVEVWIRWRSELKLLSNKHIPRCYMYFPKQPKVKSFELHGFCDASETAYAAVAYIRAISSTGQPLTSLITAKTKVAPIKRLTIPRLELCGALILARMLHYLKSLFKLPLGKVHAWTDSTIVLCWMK